MAPPCPATASLNIYLQLLQLRLPLSNSQMFTCCHLHLVSASVAYLCKHCVAANAVPNCQLVAANAMPNFQLVTFLAGYAVQGANFSICPCECSAKILSWRQMFNLSLQMRCQIFKLSLQMQYQNFNLALQMQCQIFRRTCPCSYRLAWYVPA